MHRTVRLRLPGPKYRYANIDVGVAPLIKALWDCGIPTRHCCQGRAYKGHLAYICFWEWEDAQRFLEAGLRFGWELEPERNIVRFPPEDIPWITKKLIRYCAARPPCA